MVDISQQHLTEEKEKDHIHSIALALMVLRKYQLIILMVQIVMENIGTKYFQVKMRK